MHVMPAKLKFFWQQKYIANKLQPIVSSYLHANDKRFHIPNSS